MVNMILFSQVSDNISLEYSAKYIFNYNSLEIKKKNTTLKNEYNYRSSNSHRKS